MVLLPVTMLGWAALMTVIVLFADLPVTSLLSLSVLVGGFEAIHALHVGVERIGRYRQVYYEAEGGEARWETTAMAVGPALPGGGIDPLFSLVFVCAAVINMIPAVIPGPNRLELGVIGAFHLVFIFRVV